MKIKKLKTKTVSISKVELKNLKGGNTDSTTTIIIEDITTM